MVRLAPNDLVGAKELLEQHDSGELVRERDAAEREAPVGALDHRSIEAEGPAHHEAEVDARHPALLEERSQVLARELLSVAIENAHVPIRRNPLENRVCLPLRSALLGQLDHLETRVPAQQPLVVRDVVRERGSCLADADQDQPHGCDTSEALSEENERERHINMHMSPEAMAGAYANFANISHSDYEFTITFARLDHEVDEDEIPGVVVSRISASPRFVRELIDALEDNYSKWSTREGIKNLPEYRGGDQGGDERSHSSTA
jgi:Protein of unknown function (DUF3467)